MKRKIVIITAFLLFLLGGFTSCQKEINNKLIGNWVDGDKDTLAFITTSVVHFNPCQNSPLEHWCKNYKVEKNTITFCNRILFFPHSSFPCTSCYFKYSKTQIEVGELIYKRIK